MNKVTTITCLCLLCLLLFTNPAFAVTTDSNKKLSIISKQIAAAQRNLRETLAKENSLQNQLSKAEKSIGGLSYRIKRINDNIKKNNARLDKLTVQQKQYQSKLQQQRIALAQQMRIAYQTNRENYLKILFNQQNPYQLSRMMMYYKYFSQAHMQAIKEIFYTLNELNETQKAIQQNTANLKQLLERRVTQQNKLQLSKTQRQHVLNKIHSRVKTQSQQLATLKANKKALEKVISNVREQQRNKPYIGGNFSTLRGKLSWPTRGTITQRFSSHTQGVIIRATEGQGIHAIAPGKVVFANWLKGFGLLMIIDHGNGYMTLYAHCNSLYKQVGDVVTAGDPIASVGNSGGARDVALLFQIRHNGRPLNPASWCG